MPNEVEQLNARLDGLIAATERDLKTLKGTYWYEADRLLRAAKDVVQNSSVRGTFQHPLEVQDHLQKLFGLAEQIAQVEKHLTRLLG